MLSPIEILPYRKGGHWRPIRKISGFTIVLGVVKMRNPKEDPVMQKLLAEARKRSLWFHCHWKDVWFSPDELEEEWRKGRCCWSALSWELVDPRERLDRLYRKMVDSAEEYGMFKQRVYRGKSS